MSQYFKIHPDNPQGRLLQQAARIVKDGGVIVYPTDTCYALGCHLEDKETLARIIRIRQLRDKHNFTLACRDLSESSTYARFDTPIYRLLKANTPGAYTFILRATREVPRRLLHPKKKTIGLRVPDHSIALGLLEAMGEPLMTTTLILPDQELPMSDPVEIRERLQRQVDLVIDGGYGGTLPTTLIDLVDGSPEILREGKGEWAPFL